MKETTKNTFAQVFPAMVTPMHEDGSFNYETAKKHICLMLIQ